ncbi:MAG: NADH:flavin oxidoreductase [Thermodesulfobacteriota bacterium]
MPDLFDKTQIKSLELANRSLRSATWTGTGDEKGYVTEATIALYRKLARGGIGLIVTGYQYVMQNGMQLPYMLGIYEDGQIEGLARLAATVHESGGKIVPQVVHTGVRANQELMPPGYEVWGPSATADPATGLIPHEVTKKEIGTLVEGYAAAARRAKEAGFDGVQLHGAHGYGINQFLSPLWNRRGDAYGGTLQNRYRFLAEVLEAIRGTVGEDFPVLIKLSGHDFAEGGLLPGETVEIGKRLADDGIDAIEVSGGSQVSRKGFSPVRAQILKPEQEAYLVDLAAAFKASVGVPIVTVGGIRSLKTVNDILSEGKADYVAMSRPFVREPGLVNRWKQGDTAKARCISCMGCFESGLQGKGISCKVEREKTEKSES